MSEQSGATGNSGETPTTTTPPANQNQNVTPPENTQQNTTPPPSQNQANLGGRELLAAVNALPEKIANVLLERNPPSTPTNPPAAQVGSNSPAGDGRESAGGSNSSPGNSSGNSGNSTPAGSSSKATKLAQWWFGGGN